MKIKCVGLTTDNQDGGYSISIYNDVDELVADHQGVQDGEVSREELLTEDDPYQNGYIDLHVEIEIDEKTGKLISPIHLHAGQ